MRNILCILILAFSFCGKSLHAQNLVQLPGIEGGYLYCLEEVDGEIWAGTANGIYVSSDSAVTWASLPTDTIWHVMDLLASGDTILLVGVNTQYVNAYSIYGIWRSTDKGVTWQKVYDLQQGSGGNVFHESQGVVILGLNDYMPLISYDFGLTWQGYTPPFNLFYYSANPLFATDSLVVVQWQDTVTDHLSVSRDGFATWQVMDSLPAPTPQSRYNSIQFLDSVIAIMVKQPAGSGTVFRRSHDYGRTWDTVSTPLQFNVLSHEYCADTVFAHYGSSSWYSVDHCLTWQTCPYKPNVYDTRNWNDVFIVDGILYSSQHQHYHQYQGVIAKNLSTGVTTISDNGIFATSCATLTLSGSRLYVTARGYIMYSDDGGTTWLPRVSLLDGMCNTPVHLREVPGKPDSLFVWDENKRLLWRDSLQYFSEADYSSIYASNGMINNFKNYVVYPTVLNGFFTFNIDSREVKKVNLPASLSAFDAIYKVAGLNDSLLYILYDQGVISGKLSDSVWHVSQLSAIPIGWDQPGYNNFWSEYFIPSVPALLQSSDSSMAAIGLGSPIAVTYDGGQTWINKTATGLPMQYGSPALPTLSVIWQGQWLAYIPDFGLYLSTDEGDTWQFFKAIPFLCTGMVVLNNTVYLSSYSSGLWRIGDGPALLTGKVFLDQNNNQTQDTGEPGLKRIKVITDTGKVTASRSSGEYGLLAPATGDSARLLLPSFAAATPTSIALTGQNQTQDWAVRFTQTISDLAGDATATTVFRPGFSTPVIMTCRNVGTVSQAATVSMHLDPYVTYVSATPAPTSISGDTLTWTTSMLNFQEEFQATVFVSTPVIVPPTQDSVLLTWSIATSASDVAPSNNIGFVKEPIRTSYDPNDKSCNFGERIPLRAADSAEALVYTIRFQNMGNYQADKVVVADTLDPHFDPATLEVISSSHALELAQNGPAVQFIFDPIILPAAQNDEPGSHGFVKYSVRLREGASTGTGVKNTAYIYFDFNPAIVTNTVTTTVSDDSLISVDPDRGITWRIYPNPAHDQLFVRADHAHPGECVFTLFDLAGKALGQQLLQPAGETAVRVHHLAPGLYLCRIADDTGKVLITRTISVR